MEENNDWFSSSQYNGYLRGQHYAYSEFVAGEIVPFATIRAHKKQSELVKELIKGEDFHYTVYNIKDDFDDIVFYKYPTVESMVAKFISRELGNDIEMMLLKIPIHTIHEMLNLNCTETRSQKTSPR